MRKRLSKDSWGDAGIGTTVLFITMVLTATGAASVVIEQTTEQQAQASTTAIDALVDVSKGLWVLQVLGHASGGEVDRLEVYLKLQPGSAEVDMDDVALLMMCHERRQDMAFNSTSASSSTYLCQLAMGRSDVSKQWDEYHVLGHMDVAKVTISDDDGDLGLGSYDHVSLLFLPASGLGLEYGLRLPLICQDGWFVIS